MSAVARALRVSHQASGYGFAYSVLLVLARFCLGLEQVPRSASSRLVGLDPNDLLGEVSNLSIMAAKHMSAAEVEPISPELVLVCPELREEAIGALPDPVWRAFVVDVQTRTATDLDDRQPAEPAECRQRGSPRPLGPDARAGHRHVWQHADAQEYGRIRQGALRQRGGRRKPRIALGPIESLRPPFRGLSFLPR